MTTAKEIIRSVESAKANADLIERKFTAEYLAYYIDCSLEFAHKAIQLWEGRNNF